jgi:hypothetical protein
LCFALQFKPNYNPLYLNLSFGKELPDFKITDIKYTYDGRWAALRLVCAALVRVRVFDLLRNVCVLQPTKDIAMPPDNEIWTVKPARARFTLLQSRWVSETFSTQFVSKCQHRVNKWTSIPTGADTGKESNMQFTSLEFVHDPGSTGEDYVPQGQWYATDDDGKKV